MCHCGNTGVERTPKKNQLTKLSLEKKKNLPPLLPGFELSTSRSRVRSSTNKLFWQEGGNVCGNCIHLCGSNLVTKLDGFVKCVTKYLLIIIFTVITTATSKIELLLLLLILLLKGTSISRLGSLDNF